MHNLLTFAGVTLSAALGLWLAAWVLRPDTRAGVTPADAPEAIAAVKARDVSFDPDHTPSLYRNMQVTPAGEAPVLAGMVQAGQLPPVARRMPDQPAVMQGPDGIGTYGGTWLRLASGEEDVRTITFRMSGATLVRWSPLGYPIEPHVARAIEASDDHRVWTVHLRKGMRWSDGHPLTADDVMYWWECEATHPAILSAPPDWMICHGKVGRVTRVDDYCVRFEFDHPNPLFLEILSRQAEPISFPAHYLRQFHPDPKIGDKEAIARGMQYYKMPSPSGLYTYLKEWWNPEHPRLWPWVYRTFSATSPYTFVRNPYYHVVDPAGNQLPYIDRLQFNTLDMRMMALTAANGGASMQDRHIRFADYTELMSRRASAGTRVVHWYSASRSVWVINPNHNRRVDPAEPSTRWKAQLLADKRFRQALSVALDRQQIIRGEYNGIGEPAQVVPGAESPFHYPPLKHAWTQYDPALANRMLDELGLSTRDLEGYRTFPDGSRMTFFLDYTTFTGAGPVQFVVDDWAAVGVRVIYRERARPLFYQEKDAMDFDFNVWTAESDHMPLVQPRYFVANNGEAFYATGWARWFMRGGLYNMPESRQRNCIPPPPGHPMRVAMQLHEDATSTSDPARQKQLMDQIMQIATDNLWTINLATPPPALAVVDADLRNVPEQAMSGVIFSTPANCGIELYYFANPRDSAGASQATARAILKPTLRGEVGRREAGGSVLGRIVRIGVPVVVLLGLGWISLKYPFIGQRVLIMVPTLLLISVVVFTIIRLPPGDFIDARLMQLEESGDNTAARTAEDLRRIFHTDDPPWKLYLRWLGLFWFTSFDPADEGLLQGNLGRSMETSQPINTMVGDRITLTVLISLGTIILTWALALPIGIYSAVRQYSVGDYLLTLAGFLGMCIPAFLLALILMAMTGLSGLFSPEFARQPEWTWAKFVDLLKHVWIPVLVLGIGGTAAMIRVMRANLLDELRKPYVITAMAKGVRPLRLLIKYPVRLALNPFISGLGGLFPQLVSGGAIVSMVLALPMVGPLLLQALFMEDMYLAGSMLMVMSVLGVVGTLASDLLLLWLDPRIRYEGGSR